MRDGVAVLLAQQNLDFATRVADQGSCPNAWCSSVLLVVPWVGWAAASQAAPAGKLTGAASSMGASVSRVM